MRLRTTRYALITRLMAIFAVAGLFFAACGDDDTDDAAAVVEPVDDRDELSTPQLDGLEVTVTGDVTELMADDGFQIDKDGLGDEGDPVPDNDVAVDFDDDYFVDDYDLFDYYDDDYDYYDYDYYTAFDAEWDDFDERSVLVVTPGESTVELSQAVQVNGTLRYFDEVALETVYGVDLADDLWGSYEDQYVIVADAVKSLPADRQQAVSGTNGADVTSTTSAPGDGTAEDTSSTTGASDDSTTTTGGED